jgi:outer membrane protein OmpA-like peptidoglycan-associated protein
MLLGIGGSIMVAVGIAAAQLYPAQTPGLPLVEQWVQRAKSMLDSGLTQVGIAPLESQPEPQASSLPSDAPLTAAPLTAASLTAASTASPAPAFLPDADRQDLQAELTQLQAELQALTSQSSQPIATRVQPLQTRIQTIQSKLSDFATQSQPSLATAQKPLLVTLPSDALFATGQVTLRAGSDEILGSILSDLQKFPDTSIQIAAYTDRQGSPELDRDRSLEQAKAVRQYLSQQLGAEIHWVAVGQGQNQPIAPNDSAENRQRNRRIEITIQPR